MLVVDYLNWIVQQIENNTKPNKIESLIKCLKQYPHTDYLIAIQMRLRLNAEQQHGSSINGSNNNNSSSSSNSINSVTITISRCPN